MQKSWKKVSSLENAYAFPREFYSRACKQQCADPATSDPNGLLLSTTKNDGCIARRHVLNRRREKADIEQAAEFFQQVLIEREKLGRQDGDLRRVHFKIS
jgi:hypothetical protein